jgi:hypothetical protein
MTDDFTKDAWTNAIETVRDHIITEIATDYANRFGTAPEAGRNVHLDYLPPRFNCWAIFSGGGNEVAHTFDAAPPGEFVMPARIEGRFATVGHARAFAMMAAAALPVVGASNVQWFRMLENPDVSWAAERMANDKGEQVYWKTVMPCLFVFNVTVPEEE